MSNVKLFCVLIAIPGAAVLGHDLWISFQNPPDNPLDAPLKFSALGWLWANYAPATYDWAVNTIDPKFWERYILLVLKQRALLLTLAPAFACYAVLLVMRLFRAGPFSSTGGDRPGLFRRKPSGGGKVPGGSKMAEGNFAFTEHGSGKGRFKYKRK